MSTAVGDTCAICLDEFDASNPAFSLSKCANHWFHNQCIEMQLQLKGKCPICSHMYIITEGSQPPGTMTVRFESVGACPLDSFADWGTIVIEYNFPNGVQTSQHPSPGRKYYGTYRVAFLPDNREGREVLGLLQRAFELKHTFVVGTSLTTGRDNSVVWNGIHHKTSPSGGTACFGWPDPSYFMRVREELKARGIE